MTASNAAALIGQWLASCVLLLRSNSQLFSLLSQGLSIDTVNTLTHSTWAIGWSSYLIMPCYAMPLSAGKRGVPR